MLKALSLLFCLALPVVGAPPVASAPKPAAPPLAKAGPVADFADVSFGPHAHQLLDIHLPKSGDGPFPVLVWYGGLWEPAKHVPDVNRFLPQGIAIVGVESRTLKDGQADKIDPPIKYPMDDACRAVQFLRLNAAKYHLDSARIAVAGGSQGTLPALYVGCSRDRADAASADPVERMSSKVVCVGAYRSQPTIDPKRMQEWVPGVAWGAPALGMLFEESLKRREELLPLINKWSPDALLHAGAAPIYFDNEWGLTPPGGAVTEGNYKVHSPAWGMGFKKLADQAGVVCWNHFPGHPTDKYKDIWDFLTQELKAPAH
ncbi:MAG: hypothetical protein JWO94_2677 [Verrucomicrobiaceae bacterium]|nr:hypothetical protein [Verrucomicrobiaceae bacterium]